MTAGLVIFNDSGKHWKIHCLSLFASPLLLYRPFCCCCSASCSGHTMLPFSPTHPPGCLSYVTPNRSAEERLITSPAGKAPVSSYPSSRSYTVLSPVRWSLTIVSQASSLFPTLCLCAFSLYEHACRALLHASTLAAKVQGLLPCSR